MNKTKEIIELKNRLSKLEDAVFGKDKEPAELNSEPKFKAWEAYKNEDGVIVICSHTDNELRGYGISRNTWHSIFADENEFNQKATPEETEAMLKKACEIWGGEDWENVKIKEHVFDNSKCNNKLEFKVFIYNDVIWNKRGCIMYEGKWAEKLEVDLAKDKAFYICEDVHANGFIKVLQYNDESGYYEDKLGRTWMENQLSNIEPYTQERLIELAEKF